MSAYEGPGYVGTIKATLMIAIARHPERWSENAITSLESKVWNRLLDAENLVQVEDILSVLPFASQHCETADRECDYREAFTLLRNALIEGEVQAYIREDGTGLKTPIGADCWEIDEGSMALQGGWIGVPTSTNRFVILRVAQILRLAKARRRDTRLDEQPSLSDATAAPPEPQKRGRKKTKRPAAADWLRRRFPDGLPDTPDRVALLIELKAYGIETSTKTLDRAIDDIRSAK